MESNPELAKLQKQISGKLFEAAKAAALAQATSRLESVNKALMAGPSAAQEDEADDEAEDEYEDEAEEPEDDGEEPEDEADDESRGRVRRRG